MRPDARHRALQLADVLRHPPRDPADHFLVQSQPAPLRQGAEESIFIAGGQTIIPGGGTRIEAGDMVFIMGEASQMADVLTLAGYDRFNLRRVVIAGGSREAECGPPGDPMRMFSTLWLTPDSGRLISVHYGGQARKEFYDLDRDSVIELEMWDPDGDGQMEAWRQVHLPIPEYLLPEPPPVVVAAAPPVDSLASDSAAGSVAWRIDPHRYLAERKAEHGISHLLEHMAFKGTETRSAKRIAEEIAA